MATDTKNRIKAVGKLGWLISPDITIITPPSEEEPVGTEREREMDNHVKRKKRDASIRCINHNVVFAVIRILLFLGGRLVLGF